MPIDPSLLKLLEAYKSLALPSSTQSLEDVRRNFDQGSLLTFSYKAPIRESRDVKVKGSQAEIPIRIYYPHNLPADPGMVIYYHGGGFVFGNIQTHDNLCRALAHYCGCLVASVDYRLAPEHKFPAAVVDAFDSLKWAHENSGRLGVRSLAVAGDSAGGNLAAVAAIMARDNGIPLKQQALIYPATDLASDNVSTWEFGEGLFLTLEAMNWFGRQYLSDPSQVFDYRASPARAEDLSRLAPAHIITAEYDPLRDQGEVYAARLRKFGVQAVNVRYGGQIHGFLSFWDVTPAAKQALIAVASSLKDALYD
jgi:acetyl esterase